jgi:hypothetical protein
MSSVRVISAGSLALLLARGDAAQLENGYRKISNSSYMSLDSTDSQATVQIPEEINSINTLEFLELTPQIASQLFTRFTALKESDPERADILEVAKQHVESIAGNAFVENDDWCGLMQRIGVTQKFQIRIMDPAFKAWRLTSSAKDLILWMMDERFFFLLSLDNIIQTAPKHAGRKNSSMDLQGKLKFNTPTVPIRFSSKNKTMPATGVFNTGGMSVATKASEPPSELNGCTMLFKEGSIVRLEKVFVAQNGVNFGQLLSNPPCDFDHMYSPRGLYLTKQQQVAYEYSQWAKRVFEENVVPVGILCVAVPDHLLSSIAQVVGDSWRRYVWECPKDLIYLDDYQWLTGPVCRSATGASGRTIHNHTQVVPWKLENGESTSQYITHSSQMIRLLNENCVDKVWLTQVAGSGKENSGVQQK